MMSQLIKKTHLLHDLYDTRKFHNAVDRSEFSQALVEKAKVYPQIEALAEDTFYSFFKYINEFENVREIHPDFQKNRHFLDKMMNDSKFDEMRIYTKLDQVATSIAMNTFIDLFYENNYKELKKLQEKKDLLQKQREELRQLNQDFNQISQNIDANHNMSLNEKTQSLQQAQQIITEMSKIKENQSKIEKEEEQIINSLMVHQALTDAVENSKNFDELAQIAGGYGGMETGEVRSLDVTTQFRIAKTLQTNTKFRKMIQILGKMQHLASKVQKEKTKRFFDVIESIRQSDDLIHALPSQFLYLSEPQTEDLFYSNLAEKKLLTYEFGAKIPKKKGPIICACDISGSMTGEKDLNAKAIAIALCEIAHKENRPVFVMLFDSQIKLEVQFCKHDPEFFQKIEKIASTFSGWGTSYTPIVKRAYEILTDHTFPDFERADFIIITDLDRDLDKNIEQNYLELKKVKHIETLVVIVDRNFDQKHDLRRIADHFLFCKELTDDIASEIFEGI